MVALEYGSTFGRRSLRKQCTTQTFPTMRDYKGTRGYFVAYREELQRESPTQGGQSFPNSSAVGIRECWCPYVPESILRWPTETKRHNLEAIFCSVSLSLSRTKKGGFEGGFSFNLSRDCSQRRSTHLCVESNALNIHVVSFLWLSFFGKMHNDRSRVEAHLLEYLSINRSNYVCWRSPKKKQI